MKLLIVAATKNEVLPLSENIKDISIKADLLITGVGMVATTFHLTKALSAEKYDAAINLGVCGSFNRSIRIGEVVNITEDVFSELGAEDGDDFLPLNDMKFAEKEDVFLYAKKEVDFAGVEGIKKVKGITVNTVHGNEQSIAKVVSRFHPDVESMEGAAFFYACNRFNVPALQLRAVSNYVEKRNTADWNISLAIKKLNEAALVMLNSFQHL